VQGPNKGVQEILHDPLPPRDVIKRRYEVDTNAHIRRPAQAVLH